MSVQGTLTGKGEVNTLPTLLVVAHYDAMAAAPSLAFGADSNGSGVTILLELARLWNIMYRSSKSQPAYNLVFLLSGGGKANFYGTKRFIDLVKGEQAAGQMGTAVHAAQVSPGTKVNIQELMENVEFVICLDSLGLDNQINFHVSKPPKDTLPAAK